MSVDVEEVRQRVEALRRELPAGAPIVPIATVRARDRAEVRTGVVFDVGLASPNFCRPDLGDFVTLSVTQVLTFRGLIVPGTVTSLRKKLVSRAAALTFVVADDVGEGALSMFLKSKGLPFVLTASGARGIDVVNRTLQITCGTLAPFALGKPGLGISLLATPHATVAQRKNLPDAAPVGLLFLGGDDLPHARLRARAAREVLKEL